MGVQAPHNVAWRRVRRRVSVTPFWSVWLLPVLAAAAAPWLCVLAWLYAGRHPWWLYQLARCLWAAANVLYLGFAALGLASLRSRQEAARPVHPDMRRNLTITVLATGTSFIALAANRPDWAAACSFGPGLFAALLGHGRRRLASSRALGAAAQVALVVAAFTGAFWLGAVAAVCEWMHWPTALWPLDRLAASKPGRRAYVAAEQERCAAGGG